METNRTWKHYQLEERVTRAHTSQRQMYLFLREGFLNVVIIFCFRHLKEFTILASHILWIPVWVMSFQDKRTGMSEIM